MQKSYRPKDIEQRQYERWEQSGYFAPSGDGEPYCIVVPPPNVTGSLHMGHASQDTIVDAISATGQIEAFQSIELRPEVEGDWRW